MNKKQREQNRDNARRLKKTLAVPTICPNCKQETRGGHYVPPSLGERGFFSCTAAQWGDHD